jgi:hypothetical protein
MPVAGGLFLLDLSTGRIWILPILLFFMGFGTFFKGITRGG